MAVCAIVRIARIPAAFQNSLIESSFMIIPPQLRLVYI
jgi:hypothetical protein